LIAALLPVLAVERLPHRTVVLVRDETWRISTVRPAHPYGSTVDKARGFLYVSDCPGSVVIQYALEDGRLLRVIGKGTLDHPTGIGLDREGTAFVVDHYHHRIAVFDSEGQFIRAFGKQGTAPGEFERPYDIEVAPSGEVYVVDYGNHRVQKFTHDGKLLAVWGSGKRGTAPGEFSSPLYVSLDSAGLVYVGDSSNNRIQVFTPDGRFVRQWGSIGSWAGQLRFPYEVTVFGKHIYVADTHNHRVQIFTLGGSLAGAIPVGRFPKTVTLDAQGRLYVGLLGDPHVVRLTVTR
jgi:DNA-binding beta-propeller fold protein YncE